MVSRNYLIVDPEVFSVQADRADTEPHVSWNIGVAPEQTENGLARVVIATLHSCGLEGRGTVQIGALLVPAQAENHEWFTELDELTEEDTLETLYEIAKMALLSVVATVGATDALPHIAPKPKLSFLKRSSNANVSTVET